MKRGREEKIHQCKLKRPFKCNECDYCCNSNSDLKRHKKHKHSNEKPFKCDECDYCCKSNSNLKRHKKQKHLNEKPFKCDECDYCCKRNSSLKLHKKQKHSNEKPFKCNDCDYCCKSTSNLISHKKNKHSNEKPFKCNKCDYCCKVNSALTSHKKQKHSNEKPFKCNTCNYCSKTNSGLKYHKKQVHWTAEQRREAKVPGFCTNCYLTKPHNDSFHYDSGLCGICFSFKHGKTPKRKLQKIFFDAVKLKFTTRYPKLIYTPQANDDKFIGTQGCGNIQRRQPDQGWLIGPLANGLYRFIDGELDENSHRAYEPDCEIGKMFDTSFGVDNGKTEVIFIRVGLKYKHTKKEFNNAVKQYVNRLVYWLTRTEPLNCIYINKFPARVAVEYINYNNSKSIETSKIDENTVILSINGFQC